MDYKPNACGKYLFTGENILKNLAVSQLIFRDILSFLHIHTLYDTDR